MLELSFSQAFVSPGGQVTADVSGVGRLDVSSDFSASSFSRDLVGPATVELGPAGGPGLYCVLFKLGEETARALLLLLPKEDGTLELSEATFPPATTIPLDLLQRFTTGLTSEVFKAAFAGAGREWFNHNAVDAAGTAFTCLIAVGAPETVLIAGEACAAGLQTQAVDLLAAYLSSVVDGVATITDDEKRQLKRAIGIVDLALDTKISKGVRDRLITVLEGAADQKFNSDNSMMGVKVILDNAKKYLFFFDLKP